MQADFDTLKRRPLAQFCIQHLGYTPDKKKDCRSWRDLRSPKGFSVLVNAQANPNGHYGFTRRDGQGGGTLIDLLQQEGWDWSRIRQLASENTLQIGTMPSKVQEPPKKQIPHKAPPLSIFRPFSKTQPGCFLEKQGISRATLECFGVGSEQLAAVFPLFVLKEGRFQLFSSIRYVQQGGEVAKYFRSGSRGGNFNLMAPFHLGRVTEKLPLESLVLFESPIDALSFAQLKASEFSFQRSLLLSLCGNPSKLFYQSFPSLLEFLKPARLIYAFDNDQGGRDYVKAFSALAKGEVLLPEKKDWNKQLPGL